MAELPGPADERSAERVVDQRASAAGRPARANGSASVAALAERYQALRADDPVLAPRWWSAPAAGRPARRDDRVSLSSPVTAAARPESAGPHRVGPRPARFVAAPGRRSAAD